MKEIRSFPWLATALCGIAMVMTVIGRPEAGLPAFFCFIPVVFFMVARIVQGLNERITQLEDALREANRSA